MNYSIGIDLGGARLKSAIISENGDVVEEFVEPGKAREPYPATLQQLSGVVARLRNRAGNEPSVIGVGIAGLVSFDRRRVLAAPNCPGIVNVPLVDDLERIVKVTCILENDANVMAIGEQFAGAAIGCDHFVAVTLGTGVGGAIISGGKLIRGETGGGGEIGHICIDRNGPKCGCGSNGCLESFVGTKGILRAGSRKFGSLRGESIHGLVEKAQSGDSDARDLFAYVGEMLGVGLSGMVNLFNPKLLLIGGGIASAEDHLIEPLKRELQKRAFAVYMEGLEVRKAKLGNLAGVVGAGMLGKLGS